MTAPQTEARVVTIVDLQIQNILSVENALRVVGAKVEVVRDAAAIANADLLVLPGVGSFRAAAERLHGSGMAEAIKQHAVARKRPVVGLCLGMQLLADFSEEHGVHAGLGLIPGKVIRLEEAPPDYRVPNVGWREVSLDEKAMKLLPEALNNRSYYHVHSYHFQTIDPTHTTGTSTFGPSTIASVVQRGSIVGTQFHPEKSQEAGLDLLHALITGLR
ncbi:imidazole glycerol phosphate synthase subunit HisH [Rhodoferax ferrireducens]|uniref:imidazole glycerol phosphate synthase subunit HisH n=1 Tax=Rhodoferax ferrireducens TaxID=192843 RepID=UPI000E0CC4DD|nr:imidazole glycerol phosphate synthase subunit HisH [Rhodoferax ferrireducens]